MILTVVCCAEGNVTLASWNIGFRSIDTLWECISSKTSLQQHCYSQQPIWIIIPGASSSIDATVGWDSKQRSSDKDIYASGTRVLTLGPFVMSEHLELSCAHKSIPFLSLLQDPRLIVNP